MSSIAIAFSTAIAAAIALALLLSALGIPREITAAVATALIGTVPLIREALDMWKEQGNLASSSDRIRSPEGYSLSETRIALYVSVGVFSTIQLASMVAGIVVAISGARLDSAAATSTIVTQVVFALPAAFLIGRWAGRRSTTHGIVAVIAGAAVACVAAVCAEFLLLSAVQFGTFYEDEKSWGLWLEKVLMTSPVYAATALLGYWRGRKQRLVSYLGYLLHQLSPEVRRTIVDLAYEESKALSRTPVRK